MIVVTGANGHLGRAVVENLLTRTPASRIVACVRDIAKATDLAEQGVSVRTGDFSHPETLAAAFEGATQVLVISVDKLGEEGRRLHRAAIKAAQAAGVRRILYTSHMGTHPGSPFSNHHATEEVLAGTGTAFTSLRHGFYAESAMHLIGRGFETGEIVAPEDGPVSWTTRADLAEADAMILADEGRFNGITPPLTASEAFTLADIAAIASELTGSEVKRIVVSEEEFRERRIAQGVPAPMTDLLVGVYLDARLGHFAKTDLALGNLLGRRPQSFGDLLTQLFKNNEPRK